MCAGAGDCELCPLDAKTRSLHISTSAKVINGLMVQSLRFEDNKAVEALCISESGPVQIGFNRVIVAAHGIESLKLLLNSNLPEATPKQWIGHHYQDHAIAELACIFPGAKLPYHQLSTASQIVIPELSGELEGVEYTTLGLTTPPSDAILGEAISIEKINSWDIEDAIKQVGSVMNLFVLLEIPPQWDVSVSFENGLMNLDSRGFHREKYIYDKIVEIIYSKILAAGAIPLKANERRHYKNWFGTHHLVGTLGMGYGKKSVVDPEFKLRGTKNVYIAGSSLFPRCGSRNPTLTVVALGLMLANKLNGL